MAAKVRIEARAYAQLKAMARATGSTMCRILSHAIDERYRKWMLAGLAEDYRKLRGNPEIWAEEVKDRELWGLRGNLPRD